VSEFTYQVVDTATDLERALAVRRAVFVEEQGVDKDIEYDGLDAGALQMVVKARNTVVGTARARFPEAGEAKIERMAVLPAYRGQGIGRGILALLEDELKLRRVEHVVLHAQNPVIAFYESCGYQVTGAPFVEVGIQHVVMGKRLS